MLHYSLIAVTVMVLSSDFDSTVPLPPGLAVSAIRKSIEFIEKRLADRDLVDLYLEQANIFSALVGMFGTKALDTLSNYEKHRADERMPLLLRTPAALRFASVEPMLGPVDLRPWLSDGRRLDWVIVGGESGPGARPCKLSWIREIVDQCARAGVPVFVKQLGRRAWHDDKPLDLKDSKGGDPAEWPLDDVDQLRQFPA